MNASTAPRWRLARDLQKALKVAIEEEDDAKVRQIAETLLRFVGKPQKPRRETRPPAPVIRLSERAKERHRG